MAEVIYPLSSEIEALQAALSNMGGLAEGQLTDSIEAIVRRDNALAEQAIMADSQVDRLEAEIGDRAFEFLAGNKANAQEVRICVSAIKIATDIERIGDLAKNVAKRTIELNAREPIKSYLALGGMGRQALLQVNEVMQAFATHDLDLALSVWGRDGKIDHMHSSLFRELLTYMMEDPRTIGPCTHLLFIAKNIERIGDHATNIAETIHFFITGETISEKRPKVEELSSIGIHKGK